MKDDTWAFKSGRSDPSRMSDAPPQLGVALLRIRGAYLPDSLLLTLATIAELDVIGAFMLWKKPYKENK